MALFSGGAWWGRGRRDAAGATWRTGWAVRRDWPDGGHDFFGFQAGPTGLDVLAARDREFWRRGPTRPSGWSLVQLSERDFRLHSRHRLLCRAPDCPTVTPGGQGGRREPEAGR